MSNHTNANASRDTDRLAHVAAAAGVPKKQVAAVLEALAAQIRQSLDATGTITILGLVKIERKTVPACPTWPPYVKVTVMPELLPGTDDYCNQGLHTYHESPATNERGHPICGSCGKDEIDWGRLHVRDIADVDYTVDQLKTDRFRNKWWSKDLDPAAVRHALRKGRAGIDDAIRKRVLDSVGRVYRMENGTVQPFRDGAQTPFHGNVIYYGQHATATCCRKCIETWHGIPRGRELTQEETEYLGGLLRVYVSSRLPELEEDADLSGSSARLGCCLLPCPKRSRLTVGKPRDEAQCHPSLLQRSEDEDRTQQGSDGTSVVHGGAALACAVDRREIVRR